MRWKRLFADVEAQLEEADRLELQDEITERIRGERRNVQLVDRLRMMQGQPLEVRVRGAGVVRGEIRQIGADWFLLGDETGGELLVPMAATLIVNGAGARAAVAVGGQGILWSMGLRYVLSVISRDRSLALVTLVDGSAVSGTVDAVGADFIDLLPRIPGEQRGSAGLVPVSVPVAAIGLIRRQSD